MKITDIIRRHPRRAAGTVLIMVLVAIYPREELAYVESSPDAAFRLEYYYPHFLKGAWYRYGKQMREPMFARLYRNSDNTSFGESPVIDLSFGESTTWVIEQMGEVSLGTQFAFTNVPKSPR